MTSDPTAALNGRISWPRVEVAPARVALLALLLVGGAGLLYAGRHLTFFYDEWTFILTRRGGGIHTYLDPHNGHLSLFPVVLYKVLFAIVGLHHYTPYRLVVIVLHLTCCALLFVLVSRRLGEWLALIPVALLLFLGSAYQDLLWPFQSGYLGSMAGGLAALVALDRWSGRSSELAACGLLALSVASSGVGIPFLAAAAVLVLAKDRSFRRLWIVAVPVVLFLVWYAGWGTSEHVTASSVLGAPRYVSTAAASAVSGTVGLDEAAWGPPLTLALIAALVAAWRAHHRAGATPLLLACSTGALAFWMLTAVARSDYADPTASRYVYVGAAFILLIVAETKLGTRASREWLGVAVVLLGGAILGNLETLRAAERGLRANDDSVRVALGALDVAAAAAPATFEPAPVTAPQITAGPYLEARRDLGTPALSVSQLLSAPEAWREQADHVLQEAESITGRPVAGVLGGTVPLAVESARNAVLSARGLCGRADPGGNLASVDVRVPPGGALIVRSTSAATSAVARRFATQSPTATAIVPPGAARRVSFPRDLAPGLPWQVDVAGSGPFIVCEQAA